MTYRIEWKPSARKELRRIDPPVRRRIISAVEALADDPRPSGAAAVAGSPGWLRIRVGGYRVIYSLDDGALVVLVLKVGTRGSIYRNVLG